METRTLVELMELLVERVDEITLLEELHVSSEELVERFEDKVEAHFTRLLKLVED